MDRAQTDAKDEEASTEDSVKKDGQPMKIWIRSDPTSSDGTYTTPPLSAVSGSRRKALGSLAQSRSAPSSPSGVRFAQRLSVRSPRFHQPSKVPNALVPP